MGEKIFDTIETYGGRDANEGDKFLLIGFIHKEGLFGVKKSPEEAMRYFKMSADRGNKEAMFQFADGFLKGNGSIPSLSHAEQHAKIGADAGSLDCKRMLGELFLIKNNRNDTRKGLEILYEEFQKRLNRFADKDLILHFRRRLTSLSFFKMKEAKKIIPKEYRRLEFDVFETLPLTDENIELATNVIKNTLSPEFLSHSHYHKENKTNPLYGHCFPASFVFQSLFGKENVKLFYGEPPEKTPETWSHWWNVIAWKDSRGKVVHDVTVEQFTSKGKEPPYKWGEEKPPMGFRPRLTADELYRAVAAKLELKRIKE